MNTLHQWLLWIHVPAGALSLFLFWIPAFSKKGGKLHVKTGQIYYISMWTVLVTAFALSFNNLLMGNYQSAAFLGYLSIITAHPLWYSRAILSEKREISEHFYKVKKYFNLAIFIVSLVLLSASTMVKFSEGGILYIFFGFLGIPAIREYLMPLSTAIELHKNKIFQHLKGTIITGIAAHTAFFAFGGRTLFATIFTGLWASLPWILPTVIGITIIKILEKKYTVQKSV